MKILILLTMLFLHIVDDYYLQGILAKMKQRSWWIENAPEDLYKHDYLMALIEHAFSWTFMIMSPALLFVIVSNDVTLYNIYLAVFVLNCGLHTEIDNSKANDKSISLIEDQLFHITQVVATWAMIFVIGLRYLVK